MDLKNYTVAADMVPGMTYQGTADGPMELDGVTFTVLATVTYMAEERGVVPYDSDMGDGDIALMQVVYDAYAYPFPEVTTFSPGDAVLPMDASPIDPERII